MTQPIPQTIVRANSHADLLALMPHLVGFIPRNSLVLIPFRGKRTCGALRIDLPRSTSQSALKHAATYAIGTICKIPGITAIVPTVCTDTEFAGGSAIPEAEFASIVQRRIAQSGFELRDALCLANDGWACYLDADHPPGGYPLAEIAESHIPDAIPPDLRQQGSVDGPVRVLDADPATKDRTRTALARLRIAITANDESFSSELDPLTDLTLFAEDALDWDADAIETNGDLLLFALQGPPYRDNTMLQWATNLRMGDLMMEEADRVVDDPESYDPDLANLIMGIGPRPDPERIERGIALLLRLVATADDEARRAPLCMLGWLNWALGRSSVAARYLREARTIDPSYGMAELLDTMMSNGLLPEWAFQVPPS